MLAFNTILIYISLFTIMFLLCKSANKENNWGYVFLAVIVYAIVFGCRYGVGKDFFTYEFIYYAALNGFIEIPNWEIGFIFIIKTLAKLRLHSSIFFGVIAFLQLILVFASVKKDRYVYAYLVFTYMIGCIWLAFSNGLRQELAFCFFVFALAFTDKKEWAKHYFFIVMAISMHNSAYLLLMFYPILLYKKEWFTNTKLQLALLILSYLIGESKLLSQYLFLFDEIFSINAISDSYGVYLGYEDKLYSEVTKGLGYYIILLVDIILVANSTKIKKYICSNYLTVIYNFFFIGVILKHALIESHLIQRVNYYFYGFQFIVAAYALYYFYKSMSYKYFNLLLSLYMLTFVANMLKMESHTALFRFFWEKDLFII